DGAGHKGYATADGGRGGVEPGGGGLFPSIREVRKALDGQDFKKPGLVTYYPGTIPPGWRIRALTTNEVHRLGLSEKDCDSGFGADQKKTEKRRQSKQNRQNSKRNGV